MPQLYLLLILGLISFVQASDFQQLDDEELGVGLRDGYYYKKDSSIDFLKFHSKACRTPHGGKGFKNKDYFLFSHTSRPECKRKCEHEHKCTGFEYQSHAKVCEVWVTSIDQHKLSHKRGIDCYIVKKSRKKRNNVSIIDKFKKFQNKACRDSHGDSGFKGHDFFLLHHISLHECAKECFDNRKNYGQKCTGFEFEEHDKRCEVWVEHIAQHKLEFKHGIDCYIALKFDEGEAQVTEEVKVSEV